MHAIINYASNAVPSAISDIVSLLVKFLDGAGFSKRNDD